MKRVIFPIDSSRVMWELLPLREWCRANISHPWRTRVLTASRKEVRLACFEFDHEPDAILFNMYRRF